MNFFIVVCYSLTEINEKNIIEKKFLYNGVKNNGYIINISRDFEILRNNLNNYIFIYKKYI